MRIVGLATLLWLLTAGSAAAQQEWYPLGVWRGNEPQSTESFQTLSREWRLSWSTRTEPTSAGLLVVTVYRDDGQLVNLAVSRRGQGADSARVHTPPGTYYLAVDGGGMDWVITVEEQR
jgi:hypothetical protein